MSSHDHDYYDDIAYDGHHNNQSDNQSPSVQPRHDKYSGYSSSQDYCKHSSLDAAHRFQNPSWDNPHDVQFTDYIFDLYMSNYP